VVSEGGTERFRASALGADAGGQEDRRGHQLAQAPEVLGLRGSDDRAEAAEPAVAAKAIGAGRDQSRQMLVKRSARGLEVKEVGGARVRSPD
jgi:hypothetical protein